MSLTVSIKDISSKKVYVDEVQFQSSHLQTTTNLSQPEYERYEKEAKAKLFAQVGDNIEHLIRTGNVLIRSQFGYEGLEEKEGTWLEKNRRLGLENRQSTYGTALEEHHTNASRAESNRRREIDRLDKEGFNQDGSY